MKKAQELSVLCDVDVALFIISRKGKMYEYSSRSRYVGVLYVISPAYIDIRHEISWNYHLLVILECLWRLYSPAFYFFMISEPYFGQVNLLY
ncbi:hypothetical protein QQ045_001573 [Rhodiola kirilowii]